MDLELLQKLRDINFRKALSIQLEIRPTLRSIPYYIAAIVVGLVAVFYSIAFSSCIDFAHWLAEKHPWVLLAEAPFAFMVSYWLCARFAPAASGTGVPTVNRALKLDYGVSAGEIDTLVNLKVMGVIILSSLVLIIGGGALGREGPMVHIGACLFYFTGRQFHKLWPYQEHRSWLIAGAAAGVAAAFNTPLAGIVFVLEELAEQHFHQFKTVVISAVIVAGMVAQWLSGRYLYLGYPRIDYVSASSVPIALLVGVVCGIAAAMFDRSTVFIRKTWAFFAVRSKLMFAAAMGLCVAAIDVFVDSRTTGGGISAIEELLFNDNARASWRLIAGRFLGPIVTHLSGGTGGFLAPALTLGAALGSKISVLLDPSQHNLLVMLGMAGLLSAVVRAPFTALVIVMEMTDRHSTIFPLMITAQASVAMVRVLSGKDRH